MPEFKARNRPTLSKDMECPDEREIGRAELRDRALLDGRLLCTEGRDRKPPRLSFQPSDSIAPRVRGSSSHRGSQLRSGPRFNRPEVRKIL